MKIFKIILVLVLLVIIAGAALFFFADDVMADLYVKVGDKKLAEGDIEAALVWYERVLDRQPDNYQVCATAAQWYAELGEFTICEQVLAEGIQNCPDKAELYCQLSGVYVRQDKLLDASTMLDGVTNETARAEIEKLRPAAPAITPASGIYNEYISFSIATDDTVSQESYCFFTMDDTVPSTTGLYYSEPVKLGDGKTIVTAVTVTADGMVSPIIKAEYTIEDVIQIAEFTDPVIEAAVRRELDRDPDKKIISTEAAALETLIITAEDGKISSLDDLKWLPGIKTLVFEGQDGLDWTALTSLQSLQSLTLNSCKLTALDLGFIAQFPALIHLDLHGNQVATLSALENCASLEYIDLSENSISDIAPLASLTNLKTLILSENAVEDISPLAGCAALQMLDLDENIVSDLSPLAGSSIKQLYLSRCAVTDVTPLAECSALEILDMNFCSVLDISPLAGCTALRELYISDSSISDISSISGMTSLEVLSLPSNSISQVPDLSGCTALREVYLSHNSITSVQGFVGMPALQLLDLDYNALTSVAQLAGCPSLTALYCFGMEVTDSAELTGVTIYG